MILGLHTYTESSTAILYFTRSAELEARRKSILPNDYQRNKKIVKALIDHTENIIQKSNLPYFISDSESKDLSFGQKLTQNIDYVFSQGYTSIIILGNDCPTLANEDIHNAAALLKEGYDTYGRASDGGLYLIGLQQESYHRAIFEKLSWSCETLAEDLDSYLATYSRELHCVAPTVKIDIDTKKDLRVFIESHLTDLSIYNTILHIIESIVLGIVNHIYPCVQHCYQNGISLRGPPQLAA